MIDLIMVTIVFFTGVLFGFILLSLDDGMKYFMLEVLPAKAVRDDIKVIGEKIKKGLLSEAKTIKLQGLMDNLSYKELKYLKQCQEHYLMQVIKSGENERVTS